MLMENVRFLRLIGLSISPLSKSHKGLLIDIRPLNALPFGFAHVAVDQHVERL